MAEIGPISADQAAEELKARAAENKLLFYRPCCKIHDPNGERVPCPKIICPDSKHARFHTSEKRIRVVLGGNRCISGETMIPNPISGRTMKVREIEGDFAVWSWDGEKLIPALARKPFIKGFDDLYEVSLANGSRIICTENHRILTKDGFCSVSDLSPATFVLAIEQPLFSPLETNSEHVPSIRGEDDRNFLKIVRDSLFGCLAYSHFCDEPLLAVSGNGPFSFPLGGDAQEYISPAGRDGRENRQGRSRFYRQLVRLSSRDARLRNAGRFSDIVSRVVCKLCKSISDSLRVVHQSTLAFFLRRSNGEFYRRASQSYDDISRGSPFSAVTSIKKVGRDVYYDFEVPGPNNYFAGGMIHHNSGKSILGLSELQMMATMKRHPFRKTTNPTRGRYRIYNSDYGVIEKLTLPLVKDWIPKSVLSGEGETKAEAWHNSYDSKYHILRLKNDITVDFMSYDQDADKSESVELDGVWADEEMPENIFSAVLSRLISRDGKIWMTVTPLYGISWAMKFFDGMDPNVEVFTLDIMDNPYLSEKVIREFEQSLPEHEKEARLHGKFMDLQGVVYKELRSDLHFIDSKAPGVGDPVIMALDPHPRKPSVITWCFINNREEVIFFDELEVSGTAKDIVEAIRYKESSHGSETLLRLIDPAAKAQGSNIAFETDTLREFEREGMSFTLADNSEAGYGIVHEYLSFDAKRPVGFFNKPRCYFTRDVPKTWYAMSHLMWQDWSNPTTRTRRDKQERILDKGKDFPDTVRYSLATRPSYRNFQNNRPVPIGNVLEAQKHQSRPVRDYFFGRS